MIVITNQIETNFFLPEDGEIARQKFLEQFDIAQEIWVMAYGFNMPEVCSKLKELDAKGIFCHLLIDNIQAHGPSTLPKLIDLKKTLKHADITITTAGIGSKTLGAIWHWKTLVVKTVDGYAIFDGSVNFTNTGWVQGNSARQFNSQEWAEKFIQEFEIHKEWAEKERPQYQLTEEKMAAHMMSMPSTQDSISTLKELVKEMNQENRQDIIPEIMGLCMQILDEV